jgi:integrase
LIELGFLEFVAYQKKQGYKRIFQNLYYTVGKGYGQAFSKKFNNRNFKREFIDKEFLEIGAKKRKDFHSFRHTITENLKDVEGVQDGALDYINGHYSSSHSQKTYGKRNMERIYQIISKLEYEFDLTEIKKAIKKYLED